jgi:mono/diheme cytochrome c family protein
MKKILKLVGIVLSSLIVLLVVAVMGLSASARARFNRVYDIQPAALVIPGDAESIAKGEHIASIYCANCHGDNIAGEVFFNEPVLAVIDSPNLTTGEGGIGAVYSDLDWVRAIRHGVDPQGRGLFGMPSKDFYYFSDEDLGNIIAYLKTVSPVDNQSNTSEVTLIGNVLTGLGLFGDVINAENITHTAPRPIAPARAVSVAYGGYLVTTVGCATCHGEQLAGGLSPVPGSPLGPNMTPGGVLADWTQQEFINIIRVRRSEWMPFESFSKMSDDELAAIFLYLQSLPELATVVK